MPTHFMGSEERDDPGWRSEQRHHVTLTKLPDRASFCERLQEALAYASMNKWTTAVMFVDLDDFRFVNDTLGPAHGDRLLEQAADRLARAVRRGDIVGFLGDDFALVLTNLAAGEDAGIVARKIFAGLTTPFQLAGLEICVSVSIGISLSPDDGLNEDALIAGAGAAMHEAKKSGRNAFRFHDAGRRRG